MQVKTKVTIYSTKLQVNENKLMYYQLKPGGVAISSINFNVM